MRPAGQTLPVQCERCASIKGKFAGRNAHRKNITDRNTRGRQHLQTKKRDLRQQTLPSQPWRETEATYTLISDFWFHNWEKANSHYSSSLDYGTLPHSSPSKPIAQCTANRLNRTHCLHLLTVLLKQ